MRNYCFKIAHEKLIFEKCVKLSDTCTFQNKFNSHCLKRKIPLKAKVILTQRHRLLIGLLEKGNPFDLYMEKSFT